MVRFPPVVVARTGTVHALVEPAVYDCIQLNFVRHDSATLLSESGERSIAADDDVVFAADPPRGTEPESTITVTVLYLDRDYVIDQVFWQPANLLADRLDARDLADELYSEPAQILQLGGDRASALAPWVDELVVLGLDGPFSERSHRMQALLFAVLDVLAPLVRTTPSHRSPTHAGPRRLRQPAPLRPEARPRTAPSRRLNARPA